MNCRTCAGPCCLKGSRIEGDCEGYKPQTHYEQIKAMSVEEMAMYAYKVLGHYWCPPEREAATKTCNDMGRNCQKCWLDWLQSEA